MSNSISQFKGYVLQIMNRADTIGVLVLRKDNVRMGADGNALPKREDEAIYLYYDQNKQPFESAEAAMKSAAKEINDGKIGFEIFEGNRWKLISYRNLLDELHLYYDRVNPVVTHVKEGNMIRLPDVKFRIKDKYIKPLVIDIFRKDKWQPALSKEIQRYFTNHVDVKEANERIEMMKEGAELDLQNAVLIRFVVP